MLFQRRLQLLDSKCIISCCIACDVFSMNEYHQFYRRSGKTRVSIALNDCPSQFNNVTLFTYVRRTHEVGHRQLCERADKFSFSRFDPLNRHLYSMFLYYQLLKKFERFIPRMQSRKSTVSCYGYVYGLMRTW